jgi:polyphosphate kinase
VVFAGFCAGIHPSAVVGSVFHARTPEIQTSIATASGNKSINMPCISGCLTPAKTVRGERIGGSLISVKNVLASAVDKAELSRDFPSLLVADMETMHGLAAARAQGIAASVLRVVSDGLHDDLPVPPHILFDENRQRTPLAGLCVHLIANPASLPAFTKFVRNVHLARKILAQALSGFSAKRVAFQPGGKRHPPPQIDKNAIKEPLTAECHQADVGGVNLDDPSFYISRELSWLEFNQRVLDQARDSQNPLLERLKFLCIVSSNMDEFFEVRVAGLKQQKQMHTSEAGPDGLSASDLLEAISSRVRRMVDDVYELWRDDLRPQMEQNGIRFHDYPDVPAEERPFFEKFFQEQVYPVLTPLAVDPAHPFPQLLNKSLNVIVELEGENLNTDLAVVQVPRILPRVVPFAGREGSEDYIFLGHLIQHHVGRLFHGVRIKGAHLFRITRNSNLYVDEEEVHNLLHAIEAQLRRVNRGAAVRLEVDETCPEETVERLLEIFSLEREDVFRIDGPLNLARLMPLALQIDRPELRYKRFAPVTVVSLNEEADIFFHIRKGDILLHHPYDNFQTVVDFIGQAAEDPHVLAIKQTLYRTSSDSPIVHSLIEAARNGKQVTVIIELKARFDEAANIKWARVMREAGVDVVYGVSGLKTHAKAVLVVRSEGDGIRRYAHLGTGNYHPSTARIYTDLGILTCREEITADLAETFNLLTGVSKFPGMRELLVAPYDLYTRMKEMVRREAENARQGKPSGIFVKCNALIEEGLIRELYEASNAGVPIRLLVRGTCALRPGIPGVSENIEVRSIVGRFLEHSRIFRFENNGQPEIYLGSADWMPRNLFRRVETVFPVISPNMREHLEEIIAWFWKDNVKARVMDANGLYHPRALEPGVEAFDCQSEFVADAQNRRKAKLEL